jgi:hypothetical protein
MNRREKLLAAAAGLIVLLWGGYFLAQAINRAFQSRRANIVKLRKEIEKKQDTIARGQQASRQMDTWRKQSLPNQEDLAFGIYYSWLNNLSESVGLKVVPTSRQRQGNLFRRFSFSVSGRGDLREITQLLHKFYTANILHKIRRLSIRPIADSKDLEVIMVIDAIALSSATQKELAEGEVDRPKQGELANYETVIFGRNLFAPPNQAPRLASLSDRTMRIDQIRPPSISATDADALDKLSYTLVSGPEGASLSSTGGAISWRPRQTGEYEFQVAVADDGFPSLTDEASFKITVVDPPPPAPVDETPPPKRLEFDDAGHTHLTGITTDRRGQRLAWFTVRTKGKELELAVGDAIDVGSIQATVERIDADSVVLRTEEDRRLVEVGDSLLESRTLPPTDL